MKNFIRTGRAAAGWTQAELARRASLHPKTIAYWEVRAATHVARGYGPEQIRRAFADAGITFEPGSMRIVDAQ